MNPASVVETHLCGAVVLCSRDSVFRPESASVEAAHSAACALFAAIASLPGCEAADWLPCPDELPAVGRC